MRAAASGALKGVNSILASADFEKICFCQDTNASKTWAQGLCMNPYLKVTGAYALSRSALVMVETFILWFWL